MLELEEYGYIKLSLSHPKALERLCRDNLLSYIFYYLYFIEGAGDQREYIACKFATARLRASSRSIDKVEDLPRASSQVDEHLDHASREDGRPAPAIGLCGGEF